MSGELPSYVVRNLVEVALKRSERKTRKKPIKSSLCVALPTERVQNKAEEDQVEEIKSLLKLHRQFEEQALRKFRKGIVEKKCLGKPSAFLKASNDLSAGRTEENEDYFNEISSKLAQVPSPDLTTKLPALPYYCSDTRELQYSHEKRLQSLTFHAKGAKSPPNSNPRICYSNKDDLKINSLSRYGKLQFSPGVSSPHEAQTLPQLLTIVPLSSETFAAYDSLPTFVEDDLRSGALIRYNVGSPRNAQSPVLWLVPVDELMSEDAISVDYEKYLDGDVSVRDGDVNGDVSIRDGDVNGDVNGDVSDIRESSRALVEYKPVYRKSVHFSETLHEVHLYSPVQNHRTRRRRRRSRTEEEN